MAGLFDDGGLTIDARLQDGQIVAHGDVPVVGDTVAALVVELATFLRSCGDVRTVDLRIDSGRPDEVLVIAIRRERA